MPANEDASETEDASEIAGCQQQKEKSRRETRRL
jgi:hypothetical protein